MKKLESKQYLFIIQRIMETCFYLHKKQYFTKCKGNYWSKNCLSSCPVYENRKDQCNGIEAISKCDDCILENLSFGDIKLRSLCEYARRKGLLK